MTIPCAGIVPFEASLQKSGLAPFHARGIGTLQVNLGKKCNQSCKHCHVEAGPHRTETMDGETMDRVLSTLADSAIPVVDITGGAPELHPRYRQFAAACRGMGKTVITRCNLTVLLENGCEDLPKFFRARSLVVAASLPYFRKEETDAMRGAGTFEKSVEALKRLNAVGYGVEPEAELNLVYNPGGAFLPPPQAGLEALFREELLKKHGIRFNRLYTIANMPLARFLGYLNRSRNYQKYMQTLAGGFNSCAAENAMCRDMVSVGYDGTLYDCDFNQMLDLAVNHGAPSRIEHWDAQKLARREIVTGDHCYGCTAGAGSSCGGQTSEN
ncbi:MAG: arsenosugar biosynthesis radical SAM protein ArsS [Nitrospinae bacterium]|nr:arsenosugar biosynthesis radical SAM protein ArsS [Nitrospinota bacterium]